MSARGQGSIENHGGGWRSPDPPHPQWGGRTNLPPGFNNSFYQKFHLVFLQALPVVFSEATMTLRDDVFLTMWWICVAFRSDEHFHQYLRYQRYLEFFFAHPNVS